MDDNEITADTYASSTEDYDSSSDWQSDTTSIASSLYEGFLENGRRYASLRGSEYFSPSDEQQFETYEVGHLACLLMSDKRPNPLYYAPVEAPRNILDIGTGRGSWAIDVADLFPNAVVRGVDLYPPPVSWVPPNCILEVDDVLQEWTWRQKFDLIHIRHGIGAFSPSEWDGLYKQCYDNLEPGGWFEQIEMNICCECDDGSIPPDDVLFTWGPRFFAAGEKLGKSLNITKTMRASIEKAGFLDVHEKDAKWPIGPWPKMKVLKEAGIVNLQHWLAGMEGYSMYLLTKFGDPVPWTREEVLVYLAAMRQALTNPRFHAYQYAKRIWARKPFPEEVDTHQGETEATVAKSREEGERSKEKLESGGGE
ncbi:hypothetical protein N7510_008579 [Penicillium lagena]|uniref:uncharacterized protein n=1 Tax=Penicillium lagena TaxID=94218 RepID=UPI00254003DA|nr:uncharacterized protein N7510_008579 [Penicillium lagena]KAJ5605798.1 hypothetical protein N7510_008579 [Penicillium lagena]